MLQQTQVSTVIPYFQVFMKEYDSPTALAAASEQKVLKLWQGLGYYSRARNLHAAAQRIVAEFGGKVPKTIDELQSLPGIGRYTAGAVASIAYGVRAPILDGNVARVLCRVDLVREDPRLRKTQIRLWKRAEEILPEVRVGDFNSALMELGAMVCTPRSPKCGECPVRKFCRAAAAGMAERIPKRRAAKVTPIERRWTLCLRNGSRWLIEQRPVRGRWAGMWQFVTIPADGEAGAAKFSQILEVEIGGLKSVGRIRHALTHRRYVFDVFSATTTSKKKDTHRRWVSFGELLKYPLPRPHERIAEMLRAVT
jgi:A/G-specific adenine glycosylase